MDANTPVYQVHFNYVLTNLSSPLLSLPLMSSPLNFTTNAENNKNNDQERYKDNFNNNTKSVWSSSQEFAGVNFSGENSSYN